MLLLVNRITRKRIISLSNYLANYGKDSTKDKQTYYVSYVKQHVNCEVTLNVAKKQDT